jgi:hypothetical protein
VSSLRQIGDTLHELSERVRQDVEAIHTRMVRELERVTPEAAEAPPAPHPARTQDELDVPDFLQPH